MVKDAGIIITSMVGVLLYYLATYTNTPYISPAPPEAGYELNKETVWPYDYVWVEGKPHPIYPHIYTGTKEGNWIAEAGYDFDDYRGGDLRSLTVAWVPNKDHPDYPHVVSGEEEGHWIPAVGYGFYEYDGKKLLSYRVKWVPQSKHPNYKHVHAAEKEGYWHADAGYAFDYKNGTLLSSKTHWVAGQRHPTIPNVLSYSKESFWIADAGFKFELKEKNQKVPAYYDVLHTSDLLKHANALQWQPNLPHPNCAHLISGQTTNTWRAEEGFTFVSEKTLDVVPQQTEAEKNQAMGNFVVDAGIALIAHNFSKPEQDDGFFAAGGREVAKEIRDQATQKVVGDVTEIMNPSKTRTPIACDHLAIDRQTVPNLRMTL